MHLLRYGDRASLLLFVFFLLCVSYDLLPIRRSPRVTSALRFRLGIDQLLTSPPPWPFTYIRHRIKVASLQSTSTIAAQYLDTTLDSPFTPHQIPPLRQTRTETDRHTTFDNRQTQAIYITSPNTGSLVTIIILASLYHLFPSLPLFSPPHRVSPGHIAPQPFAEEGHHQHGTAKMENECCICFEDLLTRDEFDKRLKVAAMAGCG
jgi:hypothetical protein